MINRWGVLTRELYYAIEMVAAMRERMNVVTKCYIYASS